MPKFEKSPPALVERFEAAAARHPEATRRQMFGYPALFVGGNLATGLFADGWMVRLSAADCEALLALPGAAQFAPMPGRPMRGWAVLPADVVADEGALDGWIGRALAFAGSLQPKA
jgi:hypothetical protein